MAHRNRLAAVIALCGVVLCSCGTKTPGRAVERVAVLPFQNLTGDASLDWLGGSIQADLANQLIPARNVNLLAVPSERDAFLNRPTRLITGFVDRTPAGLRLRAVIEDPETRRAVGEFSAVRGPESFLGAVEGLARQISPEARPALTNNWAAFSALGRAQTGANPEERRRGMEEAIRLDANYAPAYLALAELNLAQRDAAAARAVLAQLASRGPAPFEAAQGKAVEAALGGNAAARLEALKDMSRAAPANAALQFNAGSSLVAAKRFREGTAALERGLAADPDNGDMWNSLGYAKAYQRDLEGAKRAIARYAQLAPGPNNIDSLGEIHFHVGQFAEARRLFLENHQKNPQFFGDVGLLKAAFAAFRIEGAGAADQLFQQYFAKVKTANGARAAALEFDWWAATGRRTQAIAKAREAAGAGDASLAAIAQTHLCGYLLTAGERAPALEAAKAALRLAPNSLPAVMCFFAAQPSAPEPEWMSRADRLFADPRAEPIRKQVAAYALFFDGRYAAAEVLLRDLYRLAPAENEGEVRVLLASALAAQGKNDEARQLMSFWPLPPVSDGLFTAWSFTRAAELVKELKPPGV